MASIFSRIIAGEIPGAFIAQETNWVVLLDRFPAHLDMFTSSLGKKSPCRRSSIGRCC